MSLASHFNAMKGKSLDAHGLEGETYLTRAVRMQQHDAIKEFLDIGADANARNAKGELALYIALELRDAKAVEILVLGGASVFIKKNGMTFREHALKANLPEAVERAEIAERYRAVYAAAMAQRGF